MSKPPSDGLGLALGVTAVAVAGVVGLASVVMANDGPDRPGEEDRYFSGTITEAPYYHYGPEYGVTVQIDGLEHSLADTAPRRYRHCGSFYDGSPKQLLQAATRMLPVGTEVNGYVANDVEDWNDDGIEEILAGEESETPNSFVHVGSFEGTESVSAQLAATGWSKHWHWTMEDTDKVVQAEHEDVIRAEEKARNTPAEAFCGDAEREQEREEREDRERQRREAAAAAAQAWRDRHDPNDMDLDNDGGVSPDEMREYYGLPSGGSYGSGGSGARCYSSGGDTYSAC